MNTLARKGTNTAAELSLLAAHLNGRAWGDVTASIVESGAPTNLVSTDDKLRDRLKVIEADLSAKRDERNGAQKELDAAKDHFATAGEPSQESPEFKAVMDARRKTGAIDDRIAKLQSEQVATLKALGDGGRAAAIGRGSDAPPFGGNPWGAAEMLADNTLRSRLEHMASTSRSAGQVEVGELIDRDALAIAFGGTGAQMADVAGTTAMRRGDWAGIVPQLRRRLRILDLIPTSTMDGASVPYTQESGSFTTAAETAEGTAKPEAAVTYTDQEAPAATIAHWLKNRKQVLADVPALQGLLEGRLRYGVEQRLENQILGGNGTAPNIRGILNTSGIGTVPFSGGNLVADQALKGITNVFLADGEANAVLMHPTDWQSALSVKSAGDGQYYSGGPFSVTPHQMWGVPLIPSKAITQGTALVGDFALGAQLFIRQGVLILISDSDQDDFINNRVTILGEMRAALAVFRPAVFQTVALV